MGIASLNTILRVYRYTFDLAGGAGHEKSPGIAAGASLSALLRGDGRQTQRTASNRPVAPMPPPTHMVTMP